MGVSVSVGVSKSISVVSRCDLGVLDSGFLLEV